MKAATSFRACAVACGIALAFVAAGCKPNLDQTVSIVGDPVVLAVRSDPPEQAPTLDVQLTALYVDRDGPIAGGPISWAFCTARNPLANLGSVNTDCLKLSGTWFDPIGTGVSVSGPIPDNACQQFGPLVPQPQPGQPQGRPVDPDPTGGYYQPARLAVPSDGGTLTGISETRLTCGAGVASGGTGTVDYTRRYHTNVNPEVASFGVVEGSSVSAWTRDDMGYAMVGVDGGAAGDAGAAGGPNVVTAGQHVTLRVGWATCPLTDRCGDGICGPDEYTRQCPSDCTAQHGCTGAERYANFDITSQRVVDSRESIGVAWFTTAGAFDSDRTGRDSTDTTPSSDNGWTAPSAGGTVHMWVVLRDDRGGAGWEAYTIRVQ